MMKCGILQCDTISEELYDIAGNYPDMIKNLFTLAEHNLEFTVYKVYEGKMPSSAGEMDCYITTGSRHSVYEDIPWIKSFEELIRDIHKAGVKLAGICFGHQMIARALGGLVEKATVGWGAGVKSVAVIRNQEWMEPASDLFALQVMHQDQVIELPEGAELLATTDYCPNFMFQLGENTLGLQAHPEYDAPFAEAFVISRESRIEKEIWENALDHVHDLMDRELVARWLVRFFSS